MSVFRAGTNKSSTNVFPSVRPTLDLDFANSKTLDPRITFNRASGGSYVGADGLIKYAGVNEARFDHDPATGESLGLLVEESRTNLFPYSEDFSKSAWETFGTATKSYNVVNAPDGSLTADSINIPLNTFGGVFDNIPASANTTYTFSSYIKGTPGTIIRILLNFNVSGVTSKIVTVSDVWQRFDVTATSGASDVNVSVQYDSFGLFLGGGTFYVWGAQVEVGSFATSYIPTQGSTRTRQPDFASITGKNFSDFYRQDEGTVFVKFNLNTNGSTARIFNIDDGTSANRISGLCGNTVYQTFIAPENRGPAINFPSTFKFKLSSAHKDYATVNYLNNIYSNLVSGQNIIIPKNLNTFRIGNWHNNNFQGTTISRLTYFPKRLPNEQLIALTR